MNDDWTRELLWELVGYGIVTAIALLIGLGLFLAVPSLRKGLLALPRLRPGGWLGNDVFLAFCLLIGFPELIASVLLQMKTFAPLLGPAPDLDAPGPTAGYYFFRCLVIAYPLTLAVTLATLFAFLYIRRGTRPQHYGLTTARWPANLALGLIAFVLATPIIFAVHVPALLALPTRPNPITEVFKQHFYEWEWIFFAIRTVIAAPLLEELVFRGILLGWLRRASLAGHVAIMVMTIAIAASTGIYFHDPRDRSTVFDPSPVLFAILLTIGYGFQLYRLARRFELGEAEIQAWEPDPIEALRLEEHRIDSWKNANANLAVYGSAMLFGLFHASAWPAPIPLFVMGLVLGALARRTQNLIGPITFHALFNLASFIALYGSVTYPPAQNGNAQTMAARPSVVGSITTSVPPSQLPLRK